MQRKRYFFVLLNENSYLCGYNRKREPMRIECQLRLLPQQAATEQTICESVAREKGLDARTIKAVRVLKRSVDAAIVRYTST